MSGVWGAGRMRRNIVTTEQEFAWLQCPRCGYDLRGQIEQRCPACGSPFDADELKALREDDGMYAAAGQQLGLTAGLMAGCALLSVSVRALFVAAVSSSQGRDPVDFSDGVRVAYHIVVVCAPFLVAAPIAVILVWRFHQRLVGDRVFDANGKAFLFGAFVVLMLIVLFVWTASVAYFD